MLIAYSTAEGELASDVGDGAGLYASVLAEEIVKPGVEAVVMFRAVQRRVRATIKQEPYLGFSAMGDVYFAGRVRGRPAYGPDLNLRIYGDNWRWRKGENYRWRNSGRGHGYYRDGAWITIR